MMAGITVAHIGDTLGIACSANDVEVDSLSIDSRKVQNNSVFFALRGGKVDGHDYLADAAANGAIAAVVEQQQIAAIQQLVVKDVGRALARVAKLNRDLFKGKVVAITGSAGKTTCKNMIAAIASREVNVCATRGNLNNELGVPLTLQRLNDDHELAVLEMGAAKLGDIHYLTEIAQPDIALITNVNEAHLSGFGSLDNTAKGKGEIYASLADNAVAVVNLDDQYAQQWLAAIEQSPASVRTITFSAYNLQANVVLQNLTVNESGSQFDVSVNWEKEQRSIKIALPLLGAHNATNALAAIAVATALQIGTENIIAGLSEMQPEPGRLCLSAAANNLLLIDDSYNANPQSMRAAIDVLQAYKNNKRKTIFVAGDMAELGTDSDLMHAEIGRYAAQSGVDLLLATGSNAALYKSGFESVPAAGIAQVVPNIQAASDTLRSKSYTDAVVLIKGSRVAALEKLVALLQSTAMGASC